MQTITSADTSLNQVPAVAKLVNWESGTRNLDYGCGKYMKFSEFLAEKSVYNLRFDPYNLSDVENRITSDKVDKTPVDTATCSNVLNVIQGVLHRNIVISTIRNSLKKGGVAYFTVYEGDKTGLGQTTTKGYQNNNKTQSYMKEIIDIFGAGRVTRKGKLIIAVKARGK